MTTVLLIFSLLIAFIVLQKVKEIIRQYRCLTDTEIKGFMIGRLRKQDQAYRRAVAHLGICEQCQERLQQFDDKETLEDHLVDWTVLC